MSKFQISNFKFQITADKRQPGRSALPERRCRFRQKRPTRAFTLIEVLVATIILGITIAAVSSVIRTGMRAWRTGHGASEIGQTARITQDVVMRDLDNIYYMSESSYNIGFRNQTAWLAQQYAKEFGQTRDLRKLNDAMDEALTKRERRRPRNERKRDDEGQRDAMADFTLETISPPLNLSLRGSAGKLSFARSYKARFSGDQDTWGLRRVSYYVRDKVLYRREEDPYGFRMPADATDGNALASRNGDILDPLRVITEQVQRLYAIPEEDEDETGGDEGTNAEAGEPPAAHLLPAQIRVEEPLCSGVELFKIKYGYMDEAEWVEVENWDSQGRQYRSQKEEEFTRGHEPGTPGNPVNSPLIPPSFFARMNIPDDLPGYVSIQLGLRMPDGKGRMYSFTIYHSLPEAQEHDVPIEDEPHFGLNPNLPRL